MVVLRTLFTLLFIVFLKLLSAQVEDTTELSLVVVDGQALSGEQKDEMDTLLLDVNASQHVGRLFSQSSGLYLKTYGVGSLATTSIRGGSAGHTRVLWNDVPLESPMSGQFDFSLLPSFFVDEADVFNGSNTAYRGNGAIGGTISLENKDEVNRGLGIDYAGTVGSFGLHQEGGKIGYTNQKFGATVRGYYRRATNDFSYELAPTVPKRKQTNARFKQWGLLPEFYFRPNQKHHISAKIWWLDTYRQLPPTTTQNVSDAFQKDLNKRLVFGWDYRGNSFDIKAKTAWFDETLHYVNGRSGIDSKHSFNTWFTSIQSRFYINDNHRIELGIQNTYNIAMSAAYEKDQTQNRLANWASWNWRWRQLEMDLSARYELQDTKSLPLVGGLGIDWQFSKLLSLYGSVHRNYRSPYFNALYYQPGGNPDLLSEKGWSEELGVKLKKGNLHFTVSGFHRYIHNWIRWVLVEEDGRRFYAPSNILAVRSSGIEQRFKANWTFFKNWRLKLSQGYNFNRSVHQVPYTNPRIEKGTQLVYTPRHQAFGDMQLGYRQFYINYNYNWTDKVGTLNSTTLPSYGLSNINIGGRVKINQYAAHLSLGVFNAWNKAYRVLDRQAMPERNYQINLFIQFN